MYFILKPGAYTFNIRQQNGYLVLQATKVSLFILPQLEFYLTYHGGGLGGSLLEQLWNFLQLILFGTPVSAKPDTLSNDNRAHSQNSLSLVTDCSSLPLCPQPPSFIFLTVSKASYSVTSSKITSFPHLLLNQAFLSPVLFYVNTSISLIFLLPRSCITKSILASN